MPTGYTSKIHDGEPVTFPEFAMVCARAFGALIEMRDEPPGAEIPAGFTPNPHYAEAVKRAAERLAEVEAWTPERAEAEAAKAHAETVAEAGKSNAEARELRKRYEAMLAEVEAWQPPTPDHEELKRFMTQQLEESAEFDCHERKIPEPLSGTAYKEQEIESARWHAEYARKNHADEIERARGRTEWVRALRVSLAATAAGKD